MNHSITDLQQFDCSKLTGRQQLWAQLVEGWDIPRELADWIVWRLAADEASLQKVKKEVATLEASLESQNP
jgi:hypothetical protein